MGLPWQFLCFDMKVADYSGKILQPLFIFDYLTLVRFANGTKFCDDTFS